MSVFWRVDKTKGNMKRFFEFIKFRCYLGQRTAIRRVLLLVTREGKLEFTWFLAMFLTREAAVTTVLLQVRLELTRVFDIGILMIWKTWHCNIICANVPQVFTGLSIFRLIRLTAPLNLLRRCANELPNSFLRLWIYSNTFYTTETKSSFSRIFGREPSLGFLFCAPRLMWIVKRILVVKR